MTLASAGSDTGGVIVSDSREEARVVEELRSLLGEERRIAEADGKCYESEIAPIIEAL